MAVQSIGDPAATLARRLRSLRKRHWTDVSITQSQLAEALGAAKQISVPLISSWESITRPALPPVDRLDAYARFFATRRSVARTPFQLIDEKDLTDDERALRDRLAEELLALRDAARRESAGIGEPRVLIGPTGDPIGGGPWHFADGKPVTIVCAQLPPELRRGMPNARPEDLDYTELSTFTDLDALFELHGHIRAVNPGCQVNLRSASALNSDDYTTHLVVLGGVDWNSATRDVLRQLHIPVTQTSKDGDPDRGYFETDDGDQSRQFHPAVLDDGSGPRLEEDVAHFCRAPNPFNRLRTVTVCNGMFSRGVLGAVRTLTDARFRDRNAEYLEKRFLGSETFSILARVSIVNREVVTPDWTLSETRLHEWPEAVS